MTVSHDWSLHLIRKSGAEPEQQLAAALIANARETCAAGNVDDCHWLESCGVAYLALICPRDVDEWAVLERLMADLPARSPERGWRENAERFVQMVLDLATPARGTGPTVAMAVVCRKCGHERQLSIFEIKAGTWRKRPCDVCGHIEPPKHDDSKTEPTTAA